jgi:hypothetical protein
MCRFFLQRSFFKIRVAIDPEACARVDAAGALDDSRYGGGHLKTSSDRLRLRTLIVEVLSGLTTETHGHRFDGNRNS